LSKLVFKKDINAWKMRNIKHKNLLGIQDIHDGGENGIIITRESFDGVPLSSINRKELSEEDFKDYMIQLCDALSYLHSQKPAISHNAVTLDNILLRTDKVLKLSNFDYVSFGDTPKNDISMVGELMNSMRGKYMKHYKPIIDYCDGVYESIDDLRSDLIDV
jgi:serine/threonine protein kinase